MTDQSIEYLVARVNALDKADKNVIYERDLAFTALAESFKQFEEEETKVDFALMAMRVQEEQENLIKFPIVYGNNKKDSE
jgi:hypothetical protein